MAALSEISFESRLKYCVTKIYVDLTHRNKLVLSLRTIKRIPHL